MNFMSGRSGFYQQITAFSSSSSSSSPGDELPDEPGQVFRGPVEREHMFDKVVTPSDVGKLNRLVIPKQHAEKYFPLDSSTNEKGLLLNFEDRNGKPWRFRYSYWNSSQSYVMTKGWSRFVKDKKLDAGDIVSFQRAAKDRLFIDWRRRRPNPPSGHRWSPLYIQPLSRDYQYQYPPPHHHHIPYPYHHRGGEQMVVPVVQAKRLRLFGVNMDCPISESVPPPANQFQGDYKGTILEG